MASEASSRLLALSGKFAIIDEEDYDRALEYRWTLEGNSNNSRVITSASENAIVRKLGTHFDMRNVPANKADRKL
jgi:hypothetical protein